MTPRFQSSSDKNPDVPLSFFSRLASSKSLLAENARRIALALALVSGAPALTACGPEQQIEVSQTSVKLLSDTKARPGASTKFPVIVTPASSVSFEVAFPPSATALDTTSSGVQKPNISVKQISDGNFEITTTIPSSYDRDNLTLNVLNAGGSVFATLNIPVDISPKLENTESVVVSTTVGQTPMTASLTFTPAITRATIATDQGEKDLILSRGIDGRVIMTLPQDSIPGTHLFTVTPYNGDNKGEPFVVTVTVSEGIPTGPALPDIGPLPDRGGNPISFSLNALGGLPEGSKVVGVTGFPDADEFGNKTNLTCNDLGICMVTYDIRDIIGSQKRFPVTVEVKIPGFTSTLKRPLSIVIENEA